MPTYSCKGGDARAKLGPKSIVYTLTFESGEVWRFKVDLLRALGSPPEPTDGPYWASLPFQRCTKCPLANPAARFCPAALDAAPLLEKFSRLLSIERVRVTVQDSERCYYASTDAQTVLRALLSLVMTTSACPILSQFRSVAYFHLPLENLDESLYHVVGDYLVKQCFVAQDGGTPDYELKGLVSLYEDLAEVIACFHTRIQKAVETDAGPNAVVVLYNMSLLASMSLSERLASLRGIVNAR